MSFITVAAIATAGLGIAKAIDGGIRARRAKKEAEEAQKEYEKNKAMFASLDTSNPYLNMENVMEDLTVNRQEAEFTKQQQMQQQANVMQQMRGAAGGAGIAALAQTLAGQGSFDAQKAAASIGRQEQQNIMAERREAGRLQGMERQGEVYSRGQEQMKVKGLLGMSQQEMASAKAEQRAGREQMWGGLSDITGALSGYATTRAKYGSSGMMENPDYDPSPTGPYQEGASNERYIEDPNATKGVFGQYWDFSGDEKSGDFDWATASDEQIANYIRKKKAGK